MEEAISSVLKSIGAEVSPWIPVSERPGKEPFAKEAEYKAKDYWGKIHLRNTGELYVLVVTKAVKNWKDSVGKLNLKGRVVDAVGGLLWLKENPELLKGDLEMISSFLARSNTAVGSQSHSR
ncbi:hypothetical protein HS1genome_0164 [Sulfodiicoccus acidiphilus]|uniref:Succinate dehydrogenase n=1 Tax=Sulfodiicoccus acidiphilus TaxID=1670455 RepID=A0A348B0S3_9CREN|nr:succinate dehydrogenase [Sulfodiicoccus acidiphilus]BBD71775.1 hypothetical protein HS1genome_0164 [Sulfodiicoccus acidiphilus]GGT99131.1 hypothetical protein GCM10007116_15580 [Sulfodiicoccus acidiphilus]